MNYVEKSDMISLIAYVYIVKRRNHMQATKWDIKRIMLKLYWELKGLEKAIEDELPHAPGWVGQRKQRTGEEVKYWFHYEGGKCKAMRIPK